MINVAANSSTEAEKARRDDPEHRKRLIRLRWADGDENYDDMLILLSDYDLARQTQYMAASLSLALQSMRDDIREYAGEDICGALLAISHDLLYRTNELAERALEA